MARTARTLVVALAVLVVTSAAAPACTDGVDLPNSDLPHMPLVLPRGAPSAFCGSLCDAEPACAAYVYLASGCDTSTAGSPVCYLKTAVPASRSTACRCSAAMPPRAYPPAPARGPAAFSLVSADGAVSASLDAVTGGLLFVSVASINVTVALDGWALSLDGLVINSTALPPPDGAAQPAPDTVVFTYSGAAATGGHAVTVTYDAPTGMGGVRKTLAVAPPAGVAAFGVGSVSPWDALVLAAPAASALYASGDMGAYGVFVRLADGATGLLAAATNPFLYPSATPTADGRLLLHVGYHPALTWNATTPAAPTPAPLVADAGLLLLYPLAGVPAPPAAATRRARVELEPWAPAAAVAGAPAGAVDTGAGSRFEALSFGGAGGGAARLDPAALNKAERDAFRRAAEAHVVARPNATIAVHIPWTENDYQLDVANATHLVEYVRILTRLSQLGVDRILVASQNSDLSSIALSQDDWRWEEALWLAEGEALRNGTWAPGDALAPSLAQLLEVAHALGVFPIPYVYPILGFVAGNPDNVPEWLYPSPGPGGRKYYADLGNRAFQDYFIATMLAFSAQMGSPGWGHDYSYLIGPGTSAYSQWAGFRRMLVETRRAASGPGKPEWTVDQRQASHTWSPWFWVAGSYAEPLQSDEQTESWTALVQDVHIDRTDADHQRLMNYDYANAKFCAPSNMPGFMLHNTDRNERDGSMPYTDFNVRDFDYYAFSYAVLSAVASGGANWVVNMLPARDEGEFTAFPMASASNVSGSVAFFRAWRAWADAHIDHIRNAKPLPAPPAPGVVDGWVMGPTHAGGYAFVFLFNPNFPMLQPAPGLLALTADALDIACAANDTFVVEESFPVVGTLTTLPCGANFTYMMEGKSAVMLTIKPVAAAGVPALAGRAVRAGSSAALVSGGRELEVANLRDVGPPGAGGPPVCADEPAPAYALLRAAPGARAPDAFVRAAGGARVRVPAAWADEEAESAAAASSSSSSASSSASCFRFPRGTGGAPSPPAGFRALALRPPPPAAGATFVHSSPVAGMAYNASFAGGPLFGVVRVPAAVLAQLDARAAEYPVPWTADDAAVAWLAPGRLLAVLDVRRSLPSTAVVTATLGGAPAPVLPTWSCRTRQIESCFQGFFVDVTAAAREGVDVPFVLALPGVPAGSFGGVYYDNVDTIDA